MWCVWGPSRWLLVHPRSVAPGLLLVLSALAAAACSGSALTDSCGVVGRERSCECTGRSIGIQSCQLDGTWESCTCYSVSGAGGDGGAGGATAGAGGSAGASGRSSGVQAAGAGRGGSRGFGFPFSSAGRGSRRD
jgi:hypothetical protein